MSTKRTAESQLRPDDDDDNLVEDPGTGFKKADEETLSKRKFVTVSRRAPKTDTGPAPTWNFGAPAAPKPVDGQNNNNNNKTAVTPQKQESPEKKEKKEEEGEKKDKETKEEEASKSEEGKAEGKEGDKPAFSAGWASTPFTFGSSSNQASFSAFSSAAPAWNTASTNFTFDFSSSDSKASSSSTKLPNMPAAINVPSTSKAASTDAKKIEHQTGEENETKVYTQKRAKLYILEKGQGKGWKERGLGKLSINVNNETKAARIVMRDTACRLLVNALLWEKMKVESPVDKAVRLTTLVCEDAEGTPEGDKKEEDKKEEDKKEEDKKEEDKKEEDKKEEDKKEEDKKEDKKEEDKKEEDKKEDKKEEDKDSSAAKENDEGAGKKEDKGPTLAVRSLLFCLSSKDEVNEMMENFELHRPKAKSA